MAGVKITDLTPLATAASGDLLYIVDVSDTTESPQGTSKSIEVGNVLDFESGTWTPTFSGEDNACSNAAVTKAFYSRVGNIVTCTIYGTVDLDFSTGFSDGTISTTFPIASATPNAIGSVSIDNDKQFNGFKNSTTRLVFQSSDTSFVTADVEFYAVFQYEIV
jgi:hypothetical protein